MNLKEEKKLVSDAKNDPMAFGKLYDLHYQKILNYLLHRLNKADIAQDISSEVFFKAMTKLNTFTWQDISFSSWLYKIANNEIKMYFRKKDRKYISLEFLFENTSFEAPASTDIENEYIEAEEILAKNIQFKKIQNCISKLPLLYQEVIVLRYFEEKSLLEISEITNKNINTIKSLLLRGKEKLKKEMK